MGRFAMAASFAAPSLSVMGEGIRALQDGQEQAQGVVHLQDGDRSGHARPVVSGG